MSAMPDIAILDWSALDPGQRANALARPRPGSDLREAVDVILDAVRDGGDQALLELTARFDRAQLDSLTVPANELEAAESATDPELLSATQRAMERIHAFHAAGMPEPIRLETAPGLRCETVYRPISPVGLYVPGGSAPLVSTVMMLAVPARLAACEDLILCTPPGPDGSVHPALLATALRCGVSRIFRVGGAQAIAAMAFGTQSIPACAKLFGPGNAYVTEAKRQAADRPGGPALDMPAGPSEVLVIADAAADPRFVAWDLLSQAEHGPDSQSLLVSDSQELLQDVAGRIGGMAAALPRADILRRSLAALRLIRVSGIEEAIGLSNRYAPEHLILNCGEARRHVGEVTSAGSVFLGPWTPESLGDYASGTNHVLPTGGHARAHSGLSVGDFLRRMTIQEASPQGLAEAGPDAMALAAAEGLEAHRLAVAGRLERSGGTG